MGRQEACEIEVRVRYAETDQMGRAHHSHHLVWCEAARTAWLRRRGASYADLERRGVYLPVSRVDVEYRYPVGYDDRVRIRAWLAAVRSRTLTFEYELERPADGREVARARTDLICMDGEGGVRRLPEEIRNWPGDSPRATA